MDQVYYDYDFYPRVFIVGRPARMTIKALNDHMRFEAGHSYSVDFLAWDRGDERYYPESGRRKQCFFTADEDGCLRIENVFDHESLFLIHIRYTQGDDNRIELRVYALNEDMAGLYPYRGDLHMHTRRSDGRQVPGIVASEYRGNGYDFTVISDHHQYYPSLEARKLLHITDNGGNETSDLSDMLIVPGEEVHLPLNDLHYVNFGGRFSINALIAGCRNEEWGTGIEVRSLDKTAPDRMTKEEFCEMIRKRSVSVPREMEAERLSFAVMDWIYEQQKKAGGIGIFPHPFWMRPTAQVGEDYLEFVYRQGRFDAFEVLGGESYYEHNGLQTVFYYEHKAEGYDYPVVGSTDSHNSYAEFNPNALNCSTIIFAKANTTNALCEGIRNKNTVAVDTISKEYRLVGSYRLQKYASYLMKHWYPVHDLACRAEGYWLRRYMAGDEMAEPVLKAMKGHIPGMLKKYFDIG